jgi:hypothetical protein
MENLGSCLDSFSVLVSTAPGGAAPNRPLIPFQFGHPFHLKASVWKTREAVTFLKIAKLKVPPTDMEYVEKIGKNLVSRQSRNVISTAGRNPGFLSREDSFEMTGYR